MVVNKSLNASHQAALHALATIGADVKVNQPTYVEGRRPNKIGLVVGSGGETIKIWLTAQGDKTAVKVKTEKSFVGIAGQLLTRVIKAMGLERSDVYITNICKFRPSLPNQTSNNRAPTSEEVEIEIKAPRRYGHQMPAWGLVRITIELPLM